MARPVVTGDQLPELTPLAVPEPLPPPPRRWSEAEWAVICQGHRSQDMDHKWHAFVEDNRLFLHRSRTGRGITELLVCGDRGIYRRASDTCEALLVEAIIDGVLLGSWDTNAWTRLQSMPRG
jgi:hypothetical protein